MKGLRIFSLEDPAQPVFIGAWNDRYCHDAQVVSWTEPPYAGVEVAFCYANNTSGGVLPGIDILDVTNPAAITLIGSIDLTAPPIFSHPALFSHQGWLSHDRRTLYLNDEIDEEVYGTPTLTRIIDVQDLSNPRQVGVFSNTTAARDHNLYTRGTLIFEANYRSGFRLLEAMTPVLLNQIRYFDTYPPDDDAHYNGLWNVHPYLPSGTVIGSDIEKGLFVWTLTALEVPALSPLGQGLMMLLFVGVGVFAARRASRR